MDATDAAALRALGTQDEWWVSELPPGVDVDALRCLDAQKLVEAHHPLWNYRPEASHGWASPILMPSKWGEWPAILKERKQAGSEYAAKVRLTGLGRAALAKLSRGGEARQVARELASRDQLRVAAEESIDLIRTHPHLFTEAREWFVVFTPSRQAATIGRDSANMEQLEPTLAKTLAAFRTLVDRYAGRSDGAATWDMTPVQAARLVLAFGVAFNPEPIPPEFGLPNLPWEVPDHPRFPLAGRSGAALAGGYHDDRPWTDHPWRVVREALRIVKRQSEGVQVQKARQATLPYTKSTVDFNDASSPLDRVRDALFRVGKAASRLADEVEQLEARYAQAKSPKPAYFCVHCDDEQGRELAHDWKDFAPKSEWKPRRRAIDATLALRATIDTGITVVAEAAEWMDSPGEGLDGRWSHRTIGHLRKLRGGILCGHGRDIYPSVLPMIRSGVPRALREHARDVGERMEEVKTALMAGAVRRTLPSPLQTHAVTPVAESRNEDTARPYVSDAIDERDLALLLFLNRNPKLRRKVSDVLPETGPQDRKAIGMRLRALADRTPALVDYPKRGRTGVAILPAGIEALKTAVAQPPR